MGGDHGGGHGAGDFRHKVWSMTGGPYCRPVHWRRNTAIAMFGVFLVCIPIAMKSAELEFSPDNLLGIKGLVVVVVKFSPDNCNVLCSNVLITQSVQSHRNCGAKTLARRSIERILLLLYLLCFSVKNCDQQSVSEEDL
ncbi:hypothetical protein PR202_gb23310 [Eleusine coracana subsp. coracana]|uniref:Uncharacterized protein n=1 Tax=Eleusine coracana subsp. coracana TaxID=191504 RepID=A0AAV5FFV5_ELECO|nr:hypothetical protein PR202_gb23310 [Eleusine coracana subsp. coracana]